MKFPPITTARLEYVPSFRSYLFLPSISLSLSLYLSIYLSLLRRTFSSSAPPLVAAVLARDTPLPFARCPCNRILSTPGFSSESRALRESVLTGVLRFLRRPTRLRSLRATLRESRYLSARGCVFCVRNNLHRTRSCEIEPRSFPSRSPCLLASLVPGYLPTL